MTTTAPARIFAPPLVGGRLVQALSVALTVSTVLLAVAAWYTRGRVLWQDDRANEIWNTASTLTFLSTIFTYVATCGWLARCRRFALLAAPGFHHARGSVGLWLGWLVPVFNWWFPYQVVRDVRTATGRGTRGTGLTALWWAGFVTFTIANGIASEADDPHDARVRWFVIAAVGICVALLPWLRIVREVGEDQRAVEAERVPAVLI